MSVLTATEIDALESALGSTLPALYRQLLTEVGYGSRGTAEIYLPTIVRGLYEPFFDDPSQLFSPYFPFGCDNALQEVWVIDAANNRAASIWHETVPDDWPDETWLEYDEWVRRYIGLDGVGPIDGVNLA